MIPYNIVPDIRQTWARWAGGLRDEESTRYTEYQAIHILNHFV